MRIGPQLRTAKPALSPWSSLPLTNSCGIADVLQQAIRSRSRPTHIPLSLGQMNLQGEDLHDERVALAAAPAPAMPTLVLCSAGYQKRSISDLLNLLITGGVTHLVDVRETPWSYQRQFSRASLEPALKEVGLAYVHAKYAGNPKQIRRAAASHADCLRLYGIHLAEHPEIISQLRANLIELFERGARPCLFCYERHPADCHRNIVLDALKSDLSDLFDVKIEHLGPDGAPRFLQVIAEIPARTHSAVRAGSAGTRARQLRSSVGVP
jgi:hypothetical protein